MTADLVSLVVSAAAGALAALFSWLTRREARATDLLLRSSQVELVLGDPQRLDAASVERRIRALAQVAPSAAVVEAWRTLEALVARDQAARGAAEPARGPRIREYLVREGYVANSEAALVEALFQARNAALHVADGPPALPVNTYLPLVLQATARIPSRLS